MVRGIGTGRGALLLTTNKKRVLNDKAFLPD